MNEVKDVIRPYREVVKVVQGEKNPCWTLEFLTRVIARNKSVKETTLRDYQRKIKNLWESGKLTKESFARPWEMISELRNRGTRNTAKSQIVILMSLLSHMSNLELLKIFGSSATDLRLEYARIQKDLSEEEEAEIQRKTLREQRNWTKTEDIKRAIDRMERDAETIYQYQRVVWYKMQLYQGPARNEWQTLKVMNYNEDVDNYVNLEERKIVLNSFKTSNAMGRREFTIVDEVLPDITRMIRRRKDKGIEYLFAKMNGERFENSEFSNCMIRGMEKYLGGKRVGSQMHRKIAVTEQRKGELSLQDKKTLAERMLHGEHRNERYRRLS